MKNLKRLLLLSLLLHIFLMIDSFGQATEKCGTFSSETLGKIGLDCVRPVYYATESTIETTHFIIHFTTEDPPPGDEPPSDKTTYEYAEKVSQAAETAWGFQVNSLGWQSPPPDGDCGGGNNKYDIYIKFGWSYGYTQPETQVAGTNGYISYIVVTNVINLDGENFRPLTDDEIKVTVAHEFNHALQFGYTGTKPPNANSWFFENTSTWMEEINFPDINEWVTFFLNNPENYSPLNKPYLGIDYTGYQYEYSGALFCHVMSKWKGNSIIENVWEHAANSNQYFLNDIDYVLNQNQTSLTEVLKRYAVWRYYTGDNDDGNHFDKASLMEGLHILREHNNGTGSGNSSPDNLNSKGGTSYIVFKNADGVVNINFNGEDNTQFSAIALNKRVYFSDVENNFSLNNLNDGILNNLSCIGEDYVVLIPVVTEWQNQQSGITYSYSSVLGTGISTSFWTEKDNSNLNGDLSVQLSLPISSGHSRSLTNLLQYREKTNFERFPNFQGKPVKHNNWNSVSEEYFLINDFEASSQNNRQSAKYKFLEYAKVQILLEGSLLQGNGSGSFQDPWYVLSNGSQPGNYWIDFNGEYEPNGKEGASEKGVFLNQGWPNWDPPYYSVKADAVQDITLYTTGNPSGRTHRFYFQNWDGTDVEFENSNALETGVVFTSENAEATANLKGTQLSNDANAYKNNSQRKFIRSADYANTLHMVYESMGHVWYDV